MKRQSVVGVFVLGLAICLGSVPAHAGPPPSRFTLFGGYAFTTDNGDSNTDFGYRDSATGLHGYAGSAVYNANSHVGIEANFSGFNGTQTTFNEPPTTTNFGYKDTQRQDMYIYTFGPIISEPVGNFVLFAHFLAGGTHMHTGFTEKCSNETGSDPSICSSEDTYTDNLTGSGFAFKTGGGLDWNHGRWGIRIAEVDFVHTSVMATEQCYYGCSSGPTPATFNVSTNNVEFTAGVRINFGGMLVK